jgi:hypothetical protein
MILSNPVFDFCPGIIFHGSILASPSCTECSIASVVFWLQQHLPFTTSFKQQLIIYLNLGF